MIDSLIVKVLHQQCRTNYIKTILKDVVRFLIAMTHNTAIHVEFVLGKIFVNTKQTLICSSKNHHWWWNAKNFVLHIFADIQLNSLDLRPALCPYA